MSYSGFPQLYDPQIGKGQRISPIGPAMVEQTTRLIGAAFNGSLAIGGTASDNYWALAGSGTGVAGTIASQIATLTGGTTNGYVQVTSQRKARFLFANPNMFRALVRFAGAAVAAANTVTYIGPTLMTSGVPGPGYAFAVSATGVVSLQAYSSSGVTTLNVSSGWNGAVASYTVPDQNMHAYEIIYYAAKVWFFIDGVLMHVATPTTALLVPDLTQAIGVSTVTTTTAAVRVVEVWFASVLRFGKETTRPQITYVAANATTLCKTGAGTLHRLILGTPVNGATIKVYDAVTATNQVAGMTFGSAAIGPVVIECGFDFYTGLTIVTSGATEVSAIYD